MCQDRLSSKPDYQSRNTAYADNHSLINPRSGSMSKSSYKIAVILGDGIGKEVMPEGVRVDKAIAAACKAG